MSRTVVIIGGGQKSGRMIADRFRDNGDTVRVLSHRDHPDSLPADFTDVNDVVRKFRQLVNDLDSIDIFLYNTNSHFGPAGSVDFKKNPHWYSPRQAKDRQAQLEEQWHKNMQFGMLLPNLLVLAALEKMNGSSVGLFMTTFISYAHLDLDNPYTDLLSYKAVKSVQNHMMLAFAAHNDAGATFCSVAPHYPYEDPEKLNVVIENVYQAIKNAGPESNGKFLEVFKLLS